MAISRHIKAARFIAAAGCHSQFGAAGGRGAAALRSGVRGRGSQPICSHSPAAGVPAVRVGGGEKAEVKPARYLVAKGLPTLPRKLAEMVWRLEYVDMEEFLPVPHSLRLAEQGKPSSLQDSLVGAFDQFQALQQHQSQRRIMDIMTWVRCFTLFMAVLSQRSPEMVPDMVAHLHTVLRLQQKATSQLAWLEYDIQFQMELASSTDRSWTCGDAWQYISCLPGPSPRGDPFEMSGGATQPERSAAGKGKRPREPEGDKTAGSDRQPVKKQKKAGICKLFNVAPSGCPYGSECIFTHRCNNCGA